MSSVQPRLSSAVMLLRDLPSGQGIEVFMVRRVIQSDFMPDVYVFPGGSVSKDDLAAEQTADVCVPVAPSQADPEGRTALGTGVRAAAIRELFEEAGVLLAYRSGEILALNEADVARFDAYRQAFNRREGSLVTLAQKENLRLATDRLGYISHWITPEGMPRRFDTHFFVTTAPSEQQAAHDQLETSEGIWIQPDEALTRFEQGTFPLVFATIHQLRELAAFKSVKEALEATTTRYVSVRQPVLVQENGTSHVYLPEEQQNTWQVPEHMTRRKVYPAPEPYTVVLAPNASVMTGAGTKTIVLGGGIEGATVIDPAIDDISYLDTLIEEGTKYGGIRRILITHGHPDHIGGAEALRKRLGISIYAYSREGVPFANELIADDTTFPAGDDTLRAIHTPGHRFDHLCFYLEKARVLFAGDLIAGTGTVVISPSEGDMQAYLDSLRRLQSMDIATIVPAHGPDVTSTQEKIQEYIAHRMQREQQVILALEELPAGASVEEIVRFVYVDVNPSLHILAAESVMAHLLKLEREGIAERLENNTWTLNRPTA